MCRIVSGSIAIKLDKDMRWKVFTSKGWTAFKEIELSDLNIIEVEIRKSNYPQEALQECLETMTKKLPKTPEQHSHHRKHMLFTIQRRMDSEIDTECPNGNDEVKRKVTVWLSSLTVAELTRLNLVDKEVLNLYRAIYRLF